MLSWILRVSIMSLILIFLVHHLITFLTSTLTVPKIKDLVESPTKKYDNIFNIISHNVPEINNNSYTELDLLPSAPKDENESMKNELKNFLKKQLNTNNEDVEPLKVISYNSNSYNGNSY
jgi:hypothetical protein